MAIIDTNRVNKEDALVVATAQQLKDCLEVHRIGVENDAHYHVLFDDNFVANKGIDVARKAFEKRWVDVHGDFVDTRIHMRAMKDVDPLSMRLWMNDSFNEDDDGVVKHVYRVTPLMQVVRRLEKEGMVYLFVLDPVEYEAGCENIKNAVEALTKTTPDKPLRWLCIPFRPSYPFTPGFEVLRNIRPRYAHLYAPTRPCKAMTIQQDAWDVADLVAASMRSLVQGRDALVTAGTKQAEVVGFVFDMASPHTPRSLRESAKGQQAIAAAKKNGSPAITAGAVSREDMARLLVEDEREKGNKVLVTNELPPLVQTLFAMPHDPGVLPVVVAHKGSLSLQAMPISPLVHPLAS